MSPVSVSVGDLRLSNDKTVWIVSGLKHITIVCCWQVAINCARHAALSCSGIGRHGARLNMASTVSSKPKKKWSKSKRQKRKIQIYIYLLAWNFHHYIPFKNHWLKKPGKWSQPRKWVSQESKRTRGLTQITATLSYVHSCPHRNWPDMDRHGIEDEPGGNPPWMLSHCRHQGV